MVEVGFHRDSLVGSWINFLGLSVILEPLVLIEVVLIRLRCLKRVLDFGSSHLVLLFNMLSSKEL